MIVHTFTHQGKLLNLNEALGLAKSPGAGKYLFPKRKKAMEEALAFSIRKQLPGIHISEPFATIFTWFAPSRRADPDNIASATKYVLDAAQKVGLIKQDSWRYTSGGFMHRFRVSADGKAYVTVSFVIGASLGVPGITDGTTQTPTLFEPERIF